MDLQFGEKNGFSSVFCKTLNLHPVMKSATLFFLDLHKVQMWLSHHRREIWYTLLLPLLMQVLRYNYHYNCKSYVTITITTGSLTLPLQLQLQVLHYYCHYNCKSCVTITITTWSLTLLLPLLLQVLRYYYHYYLVHSLRPREYLFLFNNDYILNDENNAIAIK